MYTDALGKIILVLRLGLQILGLRGGAGQILLCRTGF